MVKSSGSTSSTGLQQKEGVALLGGLDGSTSSRSELKEST
jgi:hypothetical protein